MDVRAWPSFVFVSVAFPQTANQQPSPPPPPPDQPAPLFDGQLGTKSSQKDKESSTLGFNGIDPSGKLDQKMLDTPATSDSAAKAKKMTDLAPGPGDLDVFLKEGGLNKR